VCRAGKQGINEAVKAQNPEHGWQGIVGAQITLTVPKVIWVWAKIFYLKEITKEFRAKPYISDDVHPSETGGGDNSSIQLGSQIYEWKIVVRRVL